MKHDRGTRSELGRVEKNEVSNLKKQYRRREIYIHRIWTVLTASQARAGLFLLALLIEVDVGLAFN